MINKENRITGIGLLGILFSVALLCIVGGIIFERYMKSSESKIFFRIMLFTIMLNIIILVFLIFSFNKIKFVPGPSGPQGIRGRRGFNGKYDTVQKCEKQTKTLGDEYLEKRKGETIVIQKPVLGFNDKY
jgi:hypothetical protein